ncbi:MAG: PDDEXK nuclease domain-containing protein [Myxococcota bacterium]
MGSPLETDEEALFGRAERTIEAARSFADRSVNIAMVHAYWLVGRDIVEVEQAGQTRAGYGDELLKRIAGRLTERFGRGFSARTVRRIRQLYLTWPEGSPLSSELGGPEIRSALLSESGPEEIRSALLSKSGDRLRLLFPPSLGWTHYLILMKVKDAGARAFYEIEAAREGWTTRDLERQVASLLYERLAKSRDKEGVLALAREGLQVTTPVSMLKDPFVLEFLDLAERPQWRERDLEQAIIDRLESFLLELGKGFCFVARQKRITLDGDHFFVDLVFYNRLLRCFVLVDLKLGKLTHQDLGQMQMYVNLYDATERADGEAPTVGIVLCSDKNDAMVRITLPEDTQVHASRYLLYLPTEEELSKELTRERAAAERELLAAASERDDTP